jgi:hypothetical protein
MKNLKLLGALVLAAMMFIFAPSSSAQTTPIIAVGSSAFFGAAGLAAATSDPIRGGGALCGARFWTGTGIAIDSRTTLTTPNLPQETASVWIAWDNDTTPTVVCAYLATDNTIGQRLFFGTGASGNAVLQVASNACNTAAGNKISFVWDTAQAGLPIAVQNVINGTTGTACPSVATAVGTHFNVAFGDIRAEDSQVIASQRVLCNDSFATPFFPPDDKSCLGYGPGTSAPGTPFTSSYSTAQFHTAAYSFTGTDPISGLTVPQSVQQRVGAQAFLVFVNTVDTGAGGFGQLTSSATPKMTSVNSKSLSALYTGQSFYTRDLYGYSGVPAVFARALQRESLSGTYTIFETQVIRQRDGFNANSQETGLRAPTQPGYTSGCFVQSATAFPTVACDNPVSFCIGSNCALRTRVIGTGQMISVGNTATLPNTVGYAAFSLGNFGNKLNMKYLQLDGVDALYPGYSSTAGGHDGTFPGGVAGQGTVSNTPATTPGQCGGYFNGPDAPGGPAGTIAKFACNAYTLPSFDGIQSGNYRFWNIVQVQYYGSSVQTPSFSPLNIAGFVLGAQDQAGGSTKVLNDFIPATYCANAACSSTVASPILAFRSHYALLGIPPNNGIVTPSAEAGGDVSGTVINTQTELDTSLLGGSILVWIQ